jgi:hypothetical protein
MKIGGFIGSKYTFAYMEGDINYLIYPTFINWVFITIRRVGV